MDRFITAFAFAQEKRGESNPIHRHKYMYLLRSYRLTDRWGIVVGYYVERIYQDVICKLTRRDGAAPGAQASRLHVSINVQLDINHIVRRGMQARRLRQ